MSTLNIPWHPRILYKGRRFRLPVQDTTRIDLSCPGFVIEHKRFSVHENAWFFYLRAPENTGDYVESTCKDSRVVVVRHQKNIGVGGAILTGYRHAYSDGAIIAVKVDGDGQMDPSYIPDLINPLLSGESDYTKGNRFSGVRYLREMPLLRVFGNSLLSFFSKFSSGYWNILDPTNGFTAIHLSILSMLPLERISKRYFFESDLLHHLNIVDAVVTDVPIPARYRGERSSLRIYKVGPEFLIKHIYNFFMMLN